MPRSVPVRVAYELHQAGHRYLDVRYATLQPREHSLFLFPATGPFDFHGEGAGRCHGAAERRRLRTNINSQNRNRGFSENIWIAINANKGAGVYLKTLLAALQPLDVYFATQIHLSKRTLRNLRCSSRLSSYSLSWGSLASAIQSSVHLFL